MHQWSQLLSPPGHSYVTSQERLIDFDHHLHEEETSRSMPYTCRLMLLLIVWMSLCVGYETGPLIKAKLQQHKRLIFTVPIHSWSSATFEAIHVQDWSWLGHIKSRCWRDERRGGVRRYYCAPLFKSRTEVKSEQSDASQQPHLSTKYDRFIWIPKYGI